MRLKKKHQLARSNQGQPRASHLLCLRQGRERGVYLFTHAFRRCQHKKQGEDVAVCVLCSPLPAAPRPGRFTASRPPSVSTKVVVKHSHADHVKVAEVQPNLDRLLQRVAPPVVHGQAHGGRLPAPGAPHVAVLWIKEGEKEGVSWCTKKCVLILSPHTNSTPLFFPTLTHKYS